MTAATRARRQAPEVIAASASDDLPCAIRVVIVHSVRLYREALADLLHREGRVEVVGTAASLRRADEVTRELAPDVCLVGLGAMDELDTVREFAQALPAVKLVALGVGETTAEVIAWAEAGIHGFVTQDGEVDSCIAAVEAAAHGNLASRRRSPQSCYGGSQSSPRRSLTGAGRITYSRAASSRSSS